MNVKGLGTGVVRWLLAGLVGVLVIGGPARDASAANVCNAALDSMFVSGPNFVVPGDATRDTVRLQLTLGAGTITGAPTPPGPQLTCIACASTSIARRAGCRAEIREPSCPTGVTAPSRPTARG